LPDGQGLRDTLSGSTLSDQDAVSVVTGIGWAALAYFGLTIALRFLCESAVRVSDGSAWARTALRFSDLVTLPPIRRMVSGAGACYHPATMNTRPARSPPQSTP
jgi:hypothetical protein